MRNRLIILSGRLRGSAFSFSFATIASVLFGVIANRNGIGHEVVFAGFFALSFFAALFLWLAYGFAWALVPEKPAVEQRPVQEKKLVPEYKPVQESKSVEEYKPVQEGKPVEEKELVQESLPLKGTRPVVDKKLVWEPRPVVEDKKLVWENKPVEEASEEGAVYDITGRRVN